MKKEISLAIVFMLLFQRGMLAQDSSTKTFRHENMIWGGYYNSIKLNPKFTINSDAQVRASSWYAHLSQVLIRTGLTYTPNEKLSFTFGFADFLFFQKTGAANRNEYRPWQEVALKDSFKKIRIGHRIRIEERCFQQVENEQLISRFDYNTRFRYRFDFAFPVCKSKETRTLDLQLGNEVMLNAGPGIVYNYFDQNRTWIGVLIPVSKSVSVQLQYIKVFQQLATGNVLTNTNVVRFNIYHSIYL